MSLKPSAKYLGVHLYQTLSLQLHVSSICWTNFLELRKIASICSNLYRNSATMITSRLDYCSSIFELRMALPAEQIARLQKVQNCTARLVMRKSKWDQIIPLLKELHRLPMTFWIRYNIAAFAYGHFEGSAPSYLSASLNIYYSISRLVFCDLLNEKIIKIPQTTLKTFGQHSFTFLAPSVWNSLPASLRNTSSLACFRSKLKTHLFVQLSTTLFMYWLL